MRPSIDRAQNYSTHVVTYVHPYFYQVQIIPYYIVNFHLSISFIRIGKSQGITISMH